MAQEGGNVWDEHALGQTEQQKRAYKDADWNW